MNIFKRIYEIQYKFPKYLIKKYNFKSSLIPSEIHNSINHNLALLFNRPLEDFVNYYSIIHPLYDPNLHELYKKRYWLFYVDIDKDTRYYFLPTFNKLNNDLQPYLLIRKKVDNKYKHFIIVYYKIESYRKYPIMELYLKLNSEFRNAERNSILECNKNRLIKFT